MFGATTLVLAASLLAADIPAEKAFREYGDFFVGGVWTSTDSKGTKLEARWEWLLDKSFLQLTWSNSDETLHEINGIDPATGRWTVWGFDNKGVIYEGVTESAKAGEWTYRLSGRGKAGPLSWKTKEVKLGADKTRLEILESVWDGKKQPPAVQIWTRRK
jgi:hypothetical protein